MFRLFLGIFALLLVAQPATALDCGNRGTNKYHLMTTGEWVTRFVRDTEHGQKVVDLQSEFRRTTATFLVYVAIGDEYAGEHTMPTTLLDDTIQVFFEADTVHRTGSDGRLELRVETVRKVEACSFWKKVDHVRLHQSALRKRRSR